MRRISATGSVNRSSGAGLVFADPMPKARGAPRIILLLASLLALGLSAGPAPAQAGTKAIGIDVSRFQGSIDWPTVAGSGIRFAFVQASRGSGADCTVRPGQCGSDPYFAANRPAAESSGIRVGAYHRA